MNPWKTQHIGPDGDHPGRVARAVLATAGDDLPRTTVLMPSSRACAGLAHRILEVSGSDALLLPRITTTERFFEDLAERLDLRITPDLPEALRASALALDLARTSWLPGLDGTPTGLAEDLLRLFDERRLAGLDPAGADDMPPETAERIAIAWALYRERVGRDRVDGLPALRASLAAAECWPGSPTRHIVLTGFAEMAPVAAEILSRCAGLSGAEAHLLTLDEDDGSPLTRLLTATYDRVDPIHPHHPARRVMTTLAGDGGDPDPGEADDRDFPRRIAGLDPADLLRLPRCELIPAADAEDESRRVAARVVEALAEAPDRRIAVATSDRALAARVAAQLRDAGLDLDDTGGAPLSTEPEGVLVRHLLHAALSGPSREDLLEIVAHPLAAFGLDFKTRQRRARVFERNLMRGDMTESSLDGYRARAAWADTRFVRENPGATPLLGDLIDDLERALAPLLDLTGRGESTVAAQVEALLRTLEVVTAPPEDETPGEPTAGRCALADLLEDCLAASSRLPALTPRAFLSLASDLMARRQVRLHRSPHLPVQITGLLEARLEYFDLLIVAGLSDDVFPGRIERSLFGGADWREQMGRQAELFLRLLHGGRQVVLSWPIEKDGRPLLPSTFLERLMLGLPKRPKPGPIAPLRRVSAPDATAIATVQARFADEADGRGDGDRFSPPRRLSHSAVQSYLDCPYLYLMNRGFGLREADELQLEVGGRLTGDIIHEIMREFLDPEGPGIAALGRRDAEAAERTLRDLTEAVFDRMAGEFPLRRLRQAAFLAAAPEVIAFELAGRPEWRTVAREAAFSFTCGELARGLSLPAPARPDLEIHGQIDRIDRAGDGRLRIIDYKSGRIGTPKDVKLARTLQLPIYGAAAILGKTAGVDAVGIDAIEGAYYGFEPGKVGWKAPQMPANGDLPDLLKRLTDVLTEMTDARGDFPLIREIDPRPLEKLACDWCRMRGICRVDERLSNGDFEEAAT